MEHTRPLTLGLEIEVPWSAYFPEVYAQWFGSGTEVRQYKSFSPEEKRDFDLVCTQLDAIMIPRLEEASRTLGLLRGKDAYWEFVFPPLAHIPDILAIFAGLKAHGCLPNPHPAGRRFSLQITLADIVPSRASGLLLTALEILCAIPGDRIRSGFHKSSSQFVAGWARKGEGGMRLRPPEELLLGATTATEFRTLLLPETEEACIMLLSFAQKYGACIRDTPEHPHWQAIQLCISQALEHAGFESSRNWGNPNAQAEIWERYARFLDSPEAGVVREALKSRKSGAWSDTSSGRTLKSCTTTPLETNT